MLASEMIAKLPEVIATDGDLPVIWDDRDYGVHVLETVSVRLAERAPWQYSLSEPNTNKPSKVIEVR